MNFQVSEEVFMLGPKTPEAFCARSLVWQAKGEHQKAKEALDRAIEAEPDNSWSFLQFAKLMVS